MPISRTQTLTATIAISTQVSTAIPIVDATAGSFLLPSSFTGTGLTFQVSVDGVTWVDLKNAAGSAVTAPSVAANAQLPIPAEAFSFKSLKLKSGSSEVAARSITVFLKF